MFHVKQGLLHCASRSNVAFSKGKSGNPNGKKKGTPNKLTLEAKLAIEQAFDGAGGVKALTQWAKENPDGFYPVWSKLLPRNVDVTSGGKPLNADERLARLKELLGVK